MDQVVASGSSGVVWVVHPGSNVMTNAVVNVSGREMDAGLLIAFADLQIRNASSASLLAVAA
jgi:TPP-dependent indolepyruvate ferredoxin oxidoreductase alpha subunit